MLERTYRKLKENRGTVTIKVEEVLLPIFARGLLNHREQRIVFTVISDSWRWHNRQFTQRPINLSEIARLTGLNKGDVSRAWQSMVGRGVIILASALSDRQLRAAFNEHHQFWGLVNHQRWQNTNRKLAKRQPEVGETPTQARDTANSTIELHNPKNNYKNSIKNKKSGAQKKRAPSHPRFQEFVSWWRATHQTRYGCQYVWGDKDGANLRRLLNCLDFDELKARCEYALAHAGKPGHLEWFQPPFTFSQFGQSQVINCCVPAVNTNGYLTADELVTREGIHETITPGT